MIKKQQNTTKKTAKRRRLNPEERRIELLEAAIEVLMSIGSKNARVEDITRAAGTAKGTFYLYFPSWQDMLIAVREHILKQYITEMKKRFVCHTIAEWWTAFENEGMEFIRFRGKSEELHKAIFHGEIANIPTDPSLSAKTVISSWLKQGISLGACRDVDIEIAAQLIFSIMHSMGDNIAHTGEHERYMQEVNDLFRSWLGTEEVSKQDATK